MISSNERADFQVSIFSNIEILDEVVEWISDNLDPEDVFSTSDLETWATDNGFVKADDDDQTE